MEVSFSRVPQPITSTCPYGSAYADGCPGAPMGSPQLPNLLSTYGANRPPWNVAGVDYHVGQASDATSYGSVAANPTQAQLNLASHGATISGSTVTLSGANPSLGSSSIGFRFALNTVIVVAAGVSGTATVQNCVVTMNTGGQGITDSGGTYNLTVLNSEVNGSKFASSTSQSTDGGIEYSGNGTLTVHYCYLHGLPIDAIGVASGTGQVVDVRWNLFYGIGYSPTGGSGGHPDMLQFIAGTVTSGTYAFNVCCNPNDGAGQGGDNPLLDVEAQLTGIISNLVYANNVLISQGTGASPTNSLTTGSFVDDATSRLNGFSFIYNFVDPTGTLFYPPYYGTASQLEVTTGSINLWEGNRLLTTGALSNPTSVGYVAPGTTTNTPGPPLTNDVVSVAAKPSSGTVSVGSSIQFTLTCARPLTTSGASSLVLSNGAVAAYSGGSGTASLVYSYTVQSTDANATNLAITAFSGAVSDQFGNAGVMSGALVTFTGLNVSNSLIPVVNNASFTLILPATSGTLVGTMTATNSPTSWAIVSGNAAGYFAIANNGNVTVTPTGASGLTAGAYSLGVTATNSHGTSSPGTAGITASASGSCAMGNAYPDGCPGAPIGTIQFPNLLSGYPARPPWNVAGVDYYVGAPASTVFKDPTVQANLPAGASYNPATNVVTISSNNVTMNGFAFTLGGTDVGIYLNGVSGTLITNCSFTGGAPVVAATGTTNTSIIANTVNGAGGTGSEDTVWGSLFPISGSVTFKYNYVYNGDSRVLSVGDGGTIVYEFNLIRNMGDGGDSSTHVNYLEFSTGTYLATCNYNTVIQDQEGGSGEGFQLYTNGAGTISTGSSISSNTVVTQASGPGPGPALATVVHAGGTGVTGVVNSNYMDLSGGANAFYPGLTGVTYSGNIDLTTGATIPPP